MGKAPERFEVLSGKLNRIPTQYVRTKEIIEKYFEFIFNDRQKIWSDNLKIAAFGPASILWAVMIVISYKMVPSIFGFSFNIAQVLNKRNELCSFIFFVFFGIMFLLELLMACRSAMPHLSKKLIDEMESIIDSVLAYKLADDVASSTMEKLMLKQKIQLALSYEKNILSLFSKKETTLLIEVPLVFISAICLGVLLNNRDLAPACYPATAAMAQDPQQLKECVKELDFAGVLHPPYREPAQDNAQTKKK